jgi:hypothetical protein
MAEKGEKFLNLDEFKEKVYKNIGKLESLDDIESGKAFETANKGCLSFFFLPFGKNLSSYANQKAREKWNVAGLTTKADEILAKKEIKDLLCDKLDATIVLPIDAAYKLTPVLYALALEDEEKVPFDSMLFAIICRKVASVGVDAFCAKK